MPGRSNAAGQSTSRLVELIDLYPTLVALAGLPTRGSLDGVNLSPVLDDPTAETKPAAHTVVARTTRPEADHARHMSFLGRSVRTDRWRYTEWDGGNHGIELYDHHNDPRELVNLAKQADLESTRKRLSRMLAAASQSDAPH